MIKQASLRKFVFNGNRNSAQDECNRLTNYLTREMVKKKWHNRHKQVIVNNPSPSFKMDNSSSNRQPLAFHTQQTQRMYDGVEEFNQRQSTIQSSRKQKYLQQSPLYKQNRLTLKLITDKCPLENIAFSKVYSRPTNHRFLRTFNNYVSKQRYKKAQLITDKSSKSLDKPKRIPVQSSFCTFNKLLKTRMFRDHSQSSKAIS